MNIQPLEDSKESGFSDEQLASKLACPPSLGQFSQVSLSFNPSSAKAKLYRQKLAQQIKMFDLNL
jgi:hypothetical protein